jgi:hypothetical protein
LWHSQSNFARFDCFAHFEFLMRVQARAIILLFASTTYVMAEAPSVSALLQVFQRKFSKLGALKFLSVGTGSRWKFVDEPKVCRDLKRGERRGNTF